MPAHRPQDALAADGEASMRQTRPHLTIPFAVERRGGEHLVDRFDDLGIAVRGLGPALGGERRWPTTLPKRSSAGQPSGG
jgi:hypothetical protein